MDNKVIVLVTIILMCLNCQKCQQFHNFSRIGMPSRISKIALWRCSLNVFVIVLVSVFVFVIVFFVGHVMSPNQSEQMSERSQVFKMKVFSKSLCLRFFVGQVMFFYYTDQMSQRSQISKIALWRCSLNVFVFFVGQVMFSHQSEQISQRSQVCSKIKRGAGLFSINWVKNHKFVLHASHPLRLPSLLLPCFFRLVSTWVLLK